MVLVVLLQPGTAWPSMFAVQPGHRRRWGGELWAWSRFQNAPHEVQHHGPLVLVHAFGLAPREVPFAAVRVQEPPAFDHCAKHVKA